MNIYAAQSAFDWLLKNASTLDAFSVEGWNGTFQVEVSDRSIAIPLITNLRSEGFLVESFYALNWVVF